MNCPKKCKCEECEMLMDKQEILFIDDRNPFSYQPQILYRGCFKCQLTGKYERDTKSLKIGGFDDNVVYASKNPIAVDYINKHRKIQGLY